MPKQLPILTLVIAIVALGFSIFNKSPVNELNQLKREDVLSPSDLQIQKHIFRSKPAKNEVILLEASIIYDGKLVRKTINYFHTDQQIKELPLLVIDKTVFETPYEEDQNRKNIKTFRPVNLVIKCGGFHKEFDHLHFQSSHISNSKMFLKAGDYHLENNSNEAEFHYTDKCHTIAEEDGVPAKVVSFIFSMKCISYAEAKQKQPKLSDLEPNSKWTYQDNEYGEALHDYMNMTEKKHDSMKQY